jgi:hypothetical protein
MGRYSLQPTGLTACLAVRLRRSAQRCGILEGTDSWVQLRSEDARISACQSDACSNFRLDETSLAAKTYSFREVTMTSLNHEITIFGGMRWNLGIFFALILFGVFFISAECRAQAVPPRGQALQMIRPVAPPPEPPIQKEIRELKQEVQGNKIELERKIAAERLFANYTLERDQSVRRLACYMRALRRWARGRVTEEQFCRECRDCRPEQSPVTNVAECIERVTSEWSDFVRYNYAISTILGEGRK